MSFNSYLIKNKIYSISEFFINYDEKKLSTIGLRYGKSGIALLHLVMYKYLKRRVHFNKFQQIIQDIIHEFLNDNISDKRRRENVIDFTKFITFLDKEDLLDFETKEILNEFDEYIYKSMKECLIEGDFDVVDGALSMGYYFLQRIDHNKNIKTLTELTDILYDISIKNKDNIYWISALFNKDRIYTGLHGSASIIIFCEKLYKLGINKKKNHKIIVEAANYLISLKEKKTKYIYPIVVGHINERGPLEIAYGDLLIGYSLYTAGSTINNLDFMKEGVYVFEFHSNRIDEYKVVVDAGIIHGISGTAILYDKMYIKTQEKKF